MGRLADGPAKVAATNKYLAQSNKFSTEPKATNKRPAASAAFAFAAAIWNEPLVDKVFLKELLDLGNQGHPVLFQHQRVGPFPDNDKPLLRRTGEQWE